ncbi:hypothetical protein J4407_02665 [Candidatus Pacearchaeota archaeon]|nr:hypothetical protein [Candidatus Pacearchaeota archaeon]
MENKKLETIVEAVIVGFDKGKALTDGITNLNYMREISENGNKQLFQRLIESYLGYAKKINSDISSEEVRLEALDFVEFQCMVADTGKLAINLPLKYEMNGKTRKMFLDIYSGKLARDNNYIVKHSIKV